MIALRSFIFNLCFFGWSLLATVIFAPFFFLSPRHAQLSGSPWAEVVLMLAEAICGLRYEIRGSKFVTDGPVIYASKHQSAWDIVIFLTLLRRPAYILKRELLHIPFWGWYLWRMQMIAIDRDAGASSIKQMVRQAKTALEDKRPIVIFPEGTRTEPGAAPVYHPGVAALYNQLEVPVIPVALNSGLFWGKNAFTKRSGIIVIEFLPPIAPGMKKQEFIHRLQTAVETASQRLLEDSHRPAESGKM